MTHTVVLDFVAGFFAGNGLPYYIAGSTGQGENRTLRDSPTVNVVLGCSGMAIGGVAWAFADAHAHPALGYPAGALGVLTVGLIHARVWRHNPWRKRPSSSAPSVSD